MCLNDELVRSQGASGDVGRDVRQQSSLRQIEGQTYASARGRELVPVNQKGTKLGSRRISKEVAELQAAGLAETLIE
jgi:hypothetical protein